MSNEQQQEISRKRKSKDDNVVLTLSLGIQQVVPPYSSTTFPPPPSSTSPVVVAAPAPAPAPAPPVSQTGPTRVRRNPTKAQDIPQPYPWATTKRATTHTLEYLDSQQIKTITGQVQCKKCEQQYEMELDLHVRFIEIGSFLAKNKSAMHDRAPATLMNPVLPTCKLCNQDSVKPVISDKKKTINWLFLLLGQMLGCCTLAQLKYFCKHTKNHRTGAKDRVLYLTYLAICKHLDPNGPFDR